MASHGICVLRIGKDQYGAVILFKSAPRKSPGVPFVLLWAEPAEVRQGVVCRAQQCIMQVAQAGGILCNTMLER